MNYANMVSGTFLARPNRFIAHVDIAGQTETVHVKNTGRCKELLVPGTRVWCQEASSPARKTRFDLIAVEKGGRLINMDSQAPNAAAKEWLLSGGFGEIEALRAETVHGDSRFDFSFFRDGKLWFLEVKGVTLDLSKGCVMHENQSVELTKNEIRILWLLMRKQGTIVSRDEIMTDLWQSEEFVDDNTLTVNINRLRRKLESIGVSPDYLSTKRGLGYRI